MAFQFQPVKSSQLKAVAYDPTTKKMRINFGTSTYEYSNVEPQDHADFMAAESIGRHFGATFKKNDKYPFVRLSKEEHDAGAV